MCASVCTRRANKFELLINLRDKTTSKFLGESVSNKNPYFPLIGTQQAATTPVSLLCVKCANNGTSTSSCTVLHTTDFQQIHTTHIYAQHQSSNNNAFYWMLGPLIPVLYHLSYRGHAEIRYLSNQCTHRSFCTICRRLQTVPQSSTRCCIDVAHLISVRHGHKIHTNTNSDTQVYNIRSRIRKVWNSAHVARMIFVLMFWSVERARGAFHTLC